MIAGAHPYAVFKEAIDSLLSVEKPPRRSSSLKLCSTRFLGVFAAAGLCDETVNNPSKNRQGRNL